MQLERKRLTDQIIDRLVDMIEKGNFKPGDKLPPEPELMELFGVGRSSIREAINALSLFGLLTVRPGQGTHVAVFSEEHLAKPLGCRQTRVFRGFSAGFGAGLRVRQRRKRDGAALHLSPDRSSIVRDSRGLTTTTTASHKERKKI